MREGAAMSKKSAAPPLPDMDAMMELVQVFEEAKTREARLAGIQMDEMIRLVLGKRAILSGQFDGTPAIFRFYIENAETFSDRDWKELQRTAPYMSDGEFQVNAPLYHLAELGLVVVERAMGVPLMEYIWQAEDAERPRYLAPAAGWLRKYTAPTENWVTMRAPAWLNRAEKRSANQPFHKLRPLEAGIFQELQRISAPYSDAKWRVAVSHGDFHPNNLLVDGPRLTGIDTGGSAKLPIYKDMARFLAHMGRRGLIPSRTERFGVDAVGLDAFAQAFALDDIERRIWLPFMIGIEALIRVESKALSRSRIRRSAEFYEVLLEELRGIEL